MQIPGPLFIKKTPSYGYPHDKPKTVWRPSQVYNGNLYTDKTASSYWIEILEKIVFILKQGPWWLPTFGVSRTVVISIRRVVLADAAIAHR